MTPSELRDKSEQELVKMSQELEEEVFRLRFRHGSGELKQTANIGRTRKDLARANTVISERAKAARKEAR